MSAHDNAQAACAFIDALRGDVRHAVVSPGSRNTPLVLALHAAREIETHVVLDERTAAFVAIGLARATGTPTILCCTSGSAGGHYLPAVIEAYESHVPLIVVTADRPPELHGRASPQTTDQSGFFARHCVAFLDSKPPEPNSAERFYTLGAEALKLCTGPVHVNIAFREPLWAADATYAMSATVSSPGSTAQPMSQAGSDRTNSPDSDSTARLERALRGVTRGLVICGPRARQDSLHTEPELARSYAELADRLGWPLLADALSGARHQPTGGVTLVCGYDALLRSTRFRVEHRPDVVVWFGRPATSKALNHWLRDESIPTVIVSDHPDKYFPGWNVVEAFDESRDSIANELRKLSHGSSDTHWDDEWRAAEYVYRATNEQDEREWEGALARRVVAALPPGSLLHVASSMPIRDVDGFGGEFKTSLTVTSNRGVNGIDGCIATGLGHALGWRNGPSVILAGDLACLHDLGGLREAAIRSRSTTVVLVNNGGGRIFDFLPIAKHTDCFERFFLTPHDTDFEAIIAGLGARYRRLEALTAVGNALYEAVERPGLDVIEARFEGSSNRADHEEFYRTVANRLS